MFISVAAGSAKDVSILANLFELRNTLHLQQ